jgi:hypothetical protein
MTLDRKTLSGLEGETKYWETEKLGPFESCFIAAKVQGYKVSGLTPRGIRLHKPYSRNWATITEENESGSKWMLVSYNYYPKDEEPLFKES